MQEKNNPHDCCAVAAIEDYRVCKQCGKHAPLEISRYLYYAIQHGCLMKAEVLEKKPHRSPLTQGGQEIKCLSVTVESGVWTKFSMLTEFLNSNYDFEKRDSDDSKSILEDIEKKINTTLETISSDDDLVEIDDEDDIQLN